jgi:hypothetical protein
MNLSAHQPYSDTEIKRREATIEIVSWQIDRKRYCAVPFTADASPPSY